VYNDQPRRGSEAVRVPEFVAPHPKMNMEVRAGPTEAQPTAPRPSDYSPSPSWCPSHTSLFSVSNEAAV
jgi:hypothetical protein